MIPDPTPTSQTSFPMEARGRRVSSGSRRLSLTKLSWQNGTVALSCAFALNSSHLRAEEFTAQGNIESIRMVGQSAAETNRFQFTVYFSNDRWRNVLEDLQVKEGKRAGILCWETAFDGTDHFKIVRLAGSKSVDESRGSYSEHGYAKTGELSTEESLTLNLLWLGFESGKYFSGLTEPLMLSIYPVSPTNRLHFDLRSTLSGSRLPERLKIDYPGEMRAVRVVGNEGFQPGTVPRLVTNVIAYPPPFDRGFQAGDYQVFSKTNVGGWEIPMSARFDYFVLRAKGPNDMEHVLVERRNVKVVRLDAGAGGELTDVRPVFASGNAHIYDYRFTNITPQLGYAEKNKKWLDRTSPNIEATVKRLERTSAQERLPSARARWVTPLFVGVVIAPLILLVLKKTYSKTRH